MERNINLINVINIHNIRIYGFTIVELMIALAIAGVLMMIAVPGYQDYAARVTDGQAE